MLPFSEGTTYKYKDVKAYVERVFAETGVILGLQTYGSFVPGRNFLIVDDGWEDTTYSFVLTGATRTRHVDDESIFKCIYAA